MKITFLHVFMFASAVFAAVATASTAVPSLWTNAKNIEINFYKKKQTKVLVTTSSGVITPGEVELFAKISIPIKTIDNYSLYDYCFVKDSSSTCEYKKVNLSGTSEDDKKTVVLSKIAFQYLMSQHRSNIYLDSINNTSHPSTGTSSTPTTCPTSSTSSDITPATEEEKKKFNLSIKNLINSYDDVYLSPIKSFIFIDKWDDINWNATPPTTNEKLNIFGSLMYGYIDYYYDKKLRQDIDNWITKKYNISNTSSSESSTKEDKYFLNFPIPMIYSDNLTLKTTDSTTTKVTPNLELEKILQEQSSTYDFSSLTETKKMISCTKMGTITESKIKNMPNIFKSICSCT